MYNEKNRNANAKLVHAENVKMHNYRPCKMCSHHPVVMFVRTQNLSCTAHGTAIFCFFSLFVDNIFWPRVRSAMQY